MDLAEIMQQAQGMAEKVKAQKEAAKEMRVEGAAGGGMVKAVLNGEGKVVKIDIDKSIVNPDDAEMLGDLVAAAVNDAVAKLAASKAAGLSELAGGLDIAGMAKNFGIDLGKLI